MIEKEIIKRVENSFCSDLIKMVEEINSHYLEGSFLLVYIYITM